VVLLFAIVLGLLIALTTGGSFRNAAGVRIRYLPLLIGALFVQILIFTEILGTTDFAHDYGRYIYIGTLFVTLAVMLLNFHIPGMPIIALGAFLNALVITANGGKMPSPESALRRAGLLERVREGERGEGVLTNSTVVNDDTNLRFLGDVIPLPGLNVISIGDIVLGIGAIIAIVVVLRRTPEPEPEPGTGTRDSGFGAVERD